MFKHNSRITLLVAAIGAAIGMLYVGSWLYGNALAVGIGLAFCLNGFVRTVGQLKNKQPLHHAANALWACAGIVGATFAFGALMDPLAHPELWWSKGAVLLLILGGLPVIVSLHDALDEMSLRPRSMARALPPRSAGIRKR